MNKMVKNLTIKQITKDTYNKFKIIRKQQSYLFGPYELYSKNGTKYLGKQLSHDYQVSSFRDNSTNIFKYNKSEHSLFIFPLNGESLSNLMAKVQHEGQLRIWLNKYNSLQDIYIQIIKKLLSIMQMSQSPQIILECLRVNNGQLQYCYDNWMNTSFMIALQNQNQLQNYYFSQEDLQIIRSSAEYQINYQPTQSTIIFRVFLMILHLGTSHFKQRNYQYGLYKLNEAHLQLKANYFIHKYNQKGLGSLMKRVIIQRQTISTEQISKVLCFNHMNKSRNIMNLSSINSIKSKKSFTKTENYDQNQIFVVSQQKNNPNCNQLIHSSPNKSNLSQNKKQNLTTYPLQIKNIRFSNKKSQGKIGNILQNSKYEDKQRQQKKGYFIGKKNKQEALNLRKILLQINEFNATNVKILKHFGLQEYLHLNVYEQKIIQVLSNVFIKNNWIKEEYENGSIYFGEMTENRKHGKGVYLFSSNDFYYGNWSDNYMNGYGTYIFVSGQYYEGQLKKGYKDGHGKCTYQDGKQYQGSWTKNFKIGLGKVKFPNQVIFIGLFKPYVTQTEGVFLGPRNQQGKPIWQNKGILEHYNWQKNIIVEKENLQKDMNKKKKLNKCKTQFYNEFQDCNGNSYKGQTINGIKQGYGIQQNDEYLYQGQWRQNKMHGHGKLTIKNNFEVQGEWKYNILVSYHYNYTDDIF